MSERRLLVLCYFFPPLAGGGVHRVLSFVRHLPAHGWACTVVCAGPEDYWVRDATLEADVPADTEVIRVAGGSAIAAWLRGPGAREGAGRRRGGRFAMLRAAADWTLLPDSYAGWARRARATAARRLSRGGIDALLTSSPPDSVHLAGLALARGGARPWIADFRDPWIGSHFRTPPTPWHAGRQRASERSVVGGADLVLAASATHADDLRAMRDGAGTPLARHVEHLPNGFEPAGAASAAADPPPGTFTLVFTGTLSLMPDTRDFLDALARFLARRPDARARIAVRLAGPYDLDDEDRARALGVADVVSFPGPLDRAATRALQRRADLLLLWKPRGAGYRTMVPGKLYEYLDAGRPMLALLDANDEAGALAARGGAELVAPGAPDALAAALERRFDAWAARGRTPDARPAWLDAHSRGALAGRLAGLLDSMTGARA